MKHFVMTALIATCKKSNTLRKFATTFIPRNSILQFEMMALYPAVAKFQCFHNDAINIRFPNSGLILSAINNCNIESIWNQQQPNSFKSFTVSHRKFHDGNKKKNVDGKSVPTLLYVENPLTWFVNKLDFLMLRRAWDPQFDEAEFRRGTKQAIATITNLISRSMYDSLKELLTKRALTLLQHEVETSWSDEQRRLSALEIEDIQLAIPRRVHFQRILEQKFCDVDMVFIALKWAEQSGTSAMIFIEIVARFHREYTDGNLPDWTVSLFRVTRFNILPR